MDDGSAAAALSEAEIEAELAALVGDFPPVPQPKTLAQQRKDIEAQLAAKKREAVQKKGAGDKAGAIAALKEMKEADKQLKEVVAKIEAERRPRSAQEDDCFTQLVSAMSEATPLAMVPSASSTAAEEDIILLEAAMQRAEPTITKEQEAAHAADQEAIDGLVRHMRDASSPLQPDDLEADEGLAELVAVMGKPAPRWSRRSPAAEDAECTYEDDEEVMHLVASMNDRVLPAVAAAKTVAAAPEAAAKPAAAATEPAATTGPFAAAGVAMAMRIGVAAGDVSARVEELKAKALSLKGAGDVAGAIAALKEAKLLDATRCGGGEGVAAPPSGEAISRGMMAAAEAQQRGELVKSTAERQTERRAAKQAAEKEAADKEAADKEAKRTAKITELRQTAVACKAAGDTSGALAALRQLKAVENGFPVSDLHADVAPSTLEVTFLSTRLAEAGCGGEAALYAYAVLSTSELAGAVPPSVQVEPRRVEAAASSANGQSAAFEWVWTEQSSPSASTSASTSTSSSSSAPSSCTRRTIKFDLAKCRRYFERRRATLDLMIAKERKAAAPNGGVFSSIFGLSGRESSASRESSTTDAENPWVLCARGEIRLKPLLCDASTEVEVRMTSPDTGSLAAAAYINVRLRLRESIEAQEARVALQKQMVAANGNSSGGSGSSSAAASAPTLPPEEPFAFARRIICYNVLQYELDRIKDEPTEGHDGEPHFLRMALEARVRELEMQKEAGQITIESYLDGLKQGIAEERTRAIKYRDTPGGVSRATVALKHMKLMEAELKDATEAMAAGGDADDENA